MHKLTCDLCYITRFLRLRLSVVYKDKLNKEKVSKFNVGGNDYLNIKAYPYLIMDITNEEERGEVWNYQKTITLDRFGMFTFIDKAEPLIQNFQKEKTLFMYDQNNRLHVNKEIANKISITIPLSFSRYIWISPIVVKEKDSNVEMEGVVMCFNSTVNYVTLSYDEFRFLVYYIKNVDLESIGMQLMIYAEVTKDRSFSKLDQLSTAQIPSENKPVPDEIKGIGPVGKENSLPKI